MNPEFLNRTVNQFMNVMQMIGMDADSTIVRAAIRSTAKNFDRKIPPMQVERSQQFWKRLPRLKVLIPTVADFVLNEKIEKRDQTEEMGLYVNQYVENLLGSFLEKAEVRDVKHQEKIQRDIETSPIPSPLDLEHFDPEEIDMLCILYGGDPTMDDQEKMDFIVRHMLQELETQN